VHGELVFTFTDDIFDRVDADYIVCPIDGIFVPFFIEEYRFRSETTALIKLEGIDTEQQARRMTNTEVYFPAHHAEAQSAEELTWNVFVGYRMEEVHHGYLGDVTDMDTTTINTLFVVDRQGEELLIPAREEFITDVDARHRILTVNLPEGLLTLNDTHDTEEKE
jgi:16S rRNA processing protein RimM